MRIHMKYKIITLQLTGGADSASAPADGSSGSSGGSGSGSVLNLVAPLVGSSSGVSFY